MSASNLKPWDDDRLAPNGCPIKDNFLDWFGASKVVDPAGKPKVVYHGTTADFSSFSRGEYSHLGFHFGTQEQANKRFKKSDVAQMSNTKAPNIIPVFLSLENPLRTTDAGDWANPFQAWDTLNKAVKGKIQHLFESTLLDSPRQYRLDLLMKAIEDLGFDGVVYKNRIEGKGDSYIAFKPSQIKSFLGNSGLYLKNGTSMADSDEALSLMSSLKAQSFLKLQEVKHVISP